MTIPDKIGLYGFGGMGDMYKWYCLQGNIRGWGFLPALKKKHPNTQVMALVCSTNPHAVEVFEHDPYIDRVEYYPWPLNQKGNLLLPGQLHLEQILKNKGYQFMAPAGFRKLELEPEKRELYISKEDSDKLQQLTKGTKPYMVVHPFASVPERQIVELDKYNELIENIINKFNCNVIILGKSYQRSFFSKGKLQSYSKKETIHIDNPRVFNLVDKTNSRVAIKIAQSAIGFVGVHSCFSCVAASEQIRTVVLSNNKNTPIAQQTMRNWWSKNNNFSIINTEKQIWKEIVKKTCLFL